MSEVIQKQCSQCKRLVNLVKKTVVGSYTTEDNVDHHIYKDTYIFACECKAPIEDKT